MKLYRVPRRAALAAVTGILLAAAPLGCSSPAIQSAATGDFAGYKWSVVSITHDRKSTPVPRKYPVYLQFAPGGHFGANEPVNYHSGSYRVTPGGFTTTSLATTAAGYAGRDPVVLLSVSAISAFGNGTRALADVRGDTLTVTVGGYTLVAHRDGRASGSRA